MNEMKILKKDIINYIKNSENTNNNELLSELEIIYEVKEDYQQYLIKNIIDEYLKKKKDFDEVIKKRKQKLIKLKKLKLPEQRSPEWYSMRMKMVTASSLGSVIDKCHFQTRDELLLSKIEPQPFMPNPITEWGVKYEDVAIMFYEELYKVKILDFGLIPHPDFNIFGASPDGICDDTGNDEYVSRMVEIKCPPKRKFTKTVPPHYLMQVQGQLEVCNLDECDFFQVKLEEYDNFDDYCKDIFEIDGILENGRTKLNYPKSVAATYKQNDSLSYKYCGLNKTNDEIQEWIQNIEKENLFEIKYWRIERFECTLVKRDYPWWIDNIDKISNFYNELIEYKNDPILLEKLKEKIKNDSKRKRRVKQVDFEPFTLISDEEDN
jgi:putative phage-type endonuclease